MTLIAAASCLFLWPGTGPSAAGAMPAVQVIHVNIGADGANTGVSWADAYTDLQAALAVADPGDEIWVAAGTYTPGASGETDASFQLVSGVALYGGFAGMETAREQRDPNAHETILSGDIGQDDVYGDPVWHIGWNINTANSLHVVTGSGTDSTARLDGFTIVGGYAPHGYGAGLYLEAGDATIEDCTIKRNLAAFAHGGGMYLLDASPTMRRCRFVQNWVHLGQGGGIFLAGTSSPTIDDCTFVENKCTGTAGGSEAAGAAISNHSDAAVTVRRCTFSANRSEAFYPSGDTSGTYAGAINHFGIAMTVDDCVFRDNFGNAGGAIWTWRDATIRDSLFLDNDAPEYQASQGGWGGFGGGIGANAFSPITVTVSGCTFVGNYAHGGGGMRLLGSASADVSNSIFWQNSDLLGMIGPSQIRGSGARYCCIQNMLIGEPGEDPPDPADFPDCSDADPQFVDLAGRNLRLLPSSPAIDAGDPLYNMSPGEADLDGHARVLCDRIDMGAYEFGFGDFNCDRSVDLSDFASWPACLTGPASGPYLAACVPFDSELDDDIDLADFAAFAATVGD